MENDNVIVNLLRVFTFAAILYFAIESDNIQVISFSVIVLLIIIYMVTVILGYEPTNIFNIALAIIICCIGVELLSVLYQSMNPETTVSPYTYRIVKVSLFYALLILYWIIFWTIT